MKLPGIRKSTVFVSLFVIMFIILSGCAGNPSTAQKSECFKIEGKIVEEHFPYHPGNENNESSVSGPVSYCKTEDGKIHNIYNVETVTELKTDSVWDPVSDLNMIVFHRCAKLQGIIYSTTYSQGRVVETRYLCLVDGNFVQVLRSTD